MIHLMTATDWRDEQRAQTRSRIVRAVAALVAEEHPAAVSVPAVARRAGVGVATVYRYFPTKEALLDATVTVGNERAFRRVQVDPTTLHDADEFVRASFRELAEH